MENNSEQKPKNNKVFRIITISLLLILAVSLVFWLVSKSNRGTKTRYDVYIQNLKAGKIESVDIGSKTVNITYKNGKNAWFYSRPNLERLIVEQTEKYNEENSSDSTDVNISFGTTTTFSFINFIYILLVLGTSLLLIVWISRQIKGSNNKSFNFVKNRAKISVSSVKFADVAGADEEKQEVSELVEFLKNPQKFNEIGARIPKGVLLVGPPGTGKTLLAKAIAGEADVPFFTISGSDFMELFVGVGASRVRDLFIQAKKVKPCIVFIDEIDAVGRQRGAGLGGGNDEREQTLNQLLVQMDGFEPNEGIIVIAATNRADILDPALMRPGRFDRQVYINIPDVRGREEIMKVHAKNKKFDKSVDFKQIARITSGFTGADIENLLNESAILAARQNRKVITQKDITESIDKVTLGPQKKSLVVTDRDKRITAFHEAGHAVLGKFCDSDSPIHEVSIIPRGMAAGYTVSRPETDDNHITKSKLLSQITMLLGGRVSEEIFLKDISTGASSDLQRATEIARNMVTKWGMSEKVGLINFGESNEVFIGRDYRSRAVYGETEASNIDSEIHAIIDSCKLKAKQLLTSKKQIIETMVEVLLEKETLFSDEIELIFKGATKKAVIDFIESKSVKTPDSIDENTNQKLDSIEEIIIEKNKNLPIIDEKSSKLETLKSSKTSLKKTDESERKQEKVNIINNKETEDVPENIEDAISSKKTKTKDKK